MIARHRLLLAAALLAMELAASGAARAQQLDLSHGGPIAITATDGIEWRQQQRQVIARGNARAVRGNVTVTADQLIAFYRPKNGAPAQPAANVINSTDTGGNEIYRVEAEGSVHIFTTTDRAQGDHAVYDLDQAVLVMTGHDLKLTTPNDVLTARDDMEYWSQKHMAVARGNAVVVTNDSKRLAADTLVAYTDASSAAQSASAPRAAAQSASAPQATAQPASTRPNTQNTDDPLAASGKLKRVEAFGNVSVRTATDTAIGDRAVYVPDTGIALLAGKVRITRGQNQLDGTEAEVNMKTGISRLLAGGGHGRVNGLIVPNDQTNQQLSGGVPGSPPPAHPANGPGARK